jgi:transposase
VFADMEKWAEIRRLVVVEGRSRRSVCRQFDIHWNTLKKILEHTEPPGYRQSQPREKRKIGPFLAVIEEILRQDRDVHRKQHHTAIRIHQRLQSEHNYTGGYTAVKEVVRDWRRKSAEAYVPRSLRSTRRW